MDEKQIESIYREMLLGGDVPSVPGNSEPFSFLQRYLPKDYDAPILDAGCGNGAYILKLNELGYQNVLGVDLFFAAPPGISKYICASIEKLPLPDQSMNMIYSLSVIFYLDEPIEAIEEFFRLLKPGGYLVITAHTKYSLFTLDRIIKRVFKRVSVKHLKDVHFYSSLEYKKMLKEVRFKVVEIDGYRASYLFWPILHKFFKLAGVRRFLKRFSQRREGGIGFYNLLKRPNRNKRNRFLALLRSIFCYHAVLVGQKPIGSNEFEASMFLKNDNQNQINF